MEKRELGNVIKIIAGEGIWGVMWGMLLPSTILVSILSRLGAGKPMIGSIETVCGMLVLMQMVGLYLFVSRRKRKAQMIMMHLLAIVPSLLFDVCVLWTADWYSQAFIRWALFCSFAVRMIILGISGSVWLDWMRGLLHERIRGRVLGMGLFVGFAGGVLSSLLAGELIRLYDLNGYIILYLMAVCIGSASMILFWLVDDPASGEPDNEDKPNLSLLAKRFAASLGEPNFRNFLITRTLATLGFCILPFIALYYRSVQGGGLDESTVVKCGAGLTAGMAIGTLVFGWVGDKVGHRLGIVFGCAMQAVTLGVLLCVPGLLGCVLVYLLAGLCAGANSLAHINMLMETCPHDHYAGHITIGNLAMAIPLMLAPPLAGWLSTVSDEHGLRIVFVVCICFSTISLLWVLAMVREPRLLLVTQGTPLQNDTTVCSKDEGLV